MSVQLDGQADPRLERRHADGDAEVSDGGHAVGRRRGGRRDGAGDGSAGNQHEGGEQALHGSTSGLGFSEAARTTSPGLSRDLGAVWPELVPRLRCVLAARGVPRPEWDDLIQQVAVNALAADVRFTSTADLLPWAATVIRNLHVDLERRRARVTVSGNVPDGVDYAEPARQVEARLDLAAVTTAMSAWAPEDRAIVLGRVEALDASDGRTPNALYIRRHRLRRQLHAVIEGSLAAVLFSWRRLRQAIDAVGAPAVGLAVSIPMLAISWSTTFGGDPHGQPLIVSRREAPAMVATAARSGIAMAGSEKAVPAAVVHLLTQEVRSRPTGIAGRPKVAHTRVDVGTSDDPTGYVEIEDTDEDEPLFCLSDAPLVGGTCVDDPAIGDASDIAK
jgi:DNA-directed RNA polymerase specialized sigma24 family protein